MLMTESTSFNCGFQSVGLEIVWSVFFTLSRYSGGKEGGGFVTDTGKPLHVEAGPPPYPPPEYREREKSKARRATFRTYRAY
jgi:hypothetical protein